ncbi:MAG: pyridoxamine 5'-phosphate oxidase family protein [Methyloceanibacter sp.]|jgi:predicted pyridoxine 5'-phosphate oxidase superfamily flavin-nucleotide-binding protein|uniref:pyridoxamine 5'-phosphate oxidase family protein n=1 Tax=Methyloceanibacter sp. TaxID=1965321 RepID=UPI003C50A4EF
MTNPTTSWMDIAFTPAVKAAQTRRGSREGYARMRTKGKTRTAIDAGLGDFIAHARSFYLATASSKGQPYIQHRGGPPGFLRVLDEQTLAFADFSGNRQYISTGNLDENPNAMIFVMDYRTKHRVKIWGTAKVVESDEALIETLMPDNYVARAEAAIIFTVASWDTNCPQHIPLMVFAEDVETLAERVTALEAENARLRARHSNDPIATRDAP